MEERAEYKVTQRKSVKTAVGVVLLAVATTAASIWFVIREILKLVRVR